MKIKKSQGDPNITKSREFICRLFIGRLKLYVIQCEMGNCVLKNGKNSNNVYLKVQKKK